MFRYCKTSRRRHIASTVFILALFVLLGAEWSHLPLLDETPSTITGIKVQNNGTVSRDYSGANVLEYNIYEHGQINSTNGMHPVELNDLFISIKTTGRFHGSRVDLLLKTWIRMAEYQVV